MLCRKRTDNNLSNKNKPVHFGAAAERGAPGRGGDAAAGGDVQPGRAPDAAAAAPARARDAASKRHPALEVWCFVLCVFLLSPRRMMLRGWSLLLAPSCRRFLAPAVRYAVREFLAGVCGRDSPSPVHPLSRPRPVPFPALVPSGSPPIPFMSRPVMSSSRPIPPPPPSRLVPMPYM